MAEIKVDPSWGDLGLHAQRTPWQDTAELAVNGCPRTVCTEGAMKEQVEPRWDTGQEVLGCFAQGTP